VIGSRLYLLGLYLGILCINGCTAKSNELAEAELEDSLVNEDIDKGKALVSAPKRDQAAAPEKNSPSAGPVGSFFRVEYNFERLRDQLVAATSAKRNDFSIYSYDLEYSLFAPTRDGNWQRFGAARAASKADRSKYFEITSPQSGRAVKHLFVGEPTASGYCGACFAGRSQIHFLLGVAVQQENSQQPAAMETTAFKILKDGDNHIRLIADFNASRGLESVSKVRSFSFDQRRLELVYEAAGSTSESPRVKKLLIRLNRTMDSQLLEQVSDSKEFRIIAEYRGGGLPRQAVN